MGTSELLAVEDFLTYLKEQECITMSRRTLRYYAAQGILPSPAKVGGNKAHYSLAITPHLKAILRLKAVGKSLKEIKAILEKQPAITETTLAGIEQETISRVATALAEAITARWMTSTHHHARLQLVLGQTHDNISHRDAAVNFLGSYSDCVGVAVNYLQQHPCLFPPHWIGQHTLEPRYISELLQLKLFLKKSDSKMSRHQQMSTWMRRLTTAKEKVRRGMAKLIQNHIETLQTELTQWRSL